MSSYYSKLMGFAPDNTLNFPSNLIWKTTEPPGMAFFAWEACRESILTLDKLKVRGFTKVNGCFMCLGEEENCRYLLLRCPAAYELWCMVYGLLGICWVAAGSIVDEVQALGGVGLKTDIAKLIPI